MKKPLLHFIAATSLVSIGLTLSGTASAACAYPGPAANMGTITFNGGTIVAKRTLAVGQMIGSTTIMGPWISGPLAKCTPDGGSLPYQSEILWGRPVPGMGNVYSTNIPGVGYRVSAAATPFAVIPGSIVKNWPAMPDTGGFTPSTFWPTQVELIKTANRVGNGKLDPVPVARLFGANPSEPYMLFKLGNIQILVQSCQVAVSSKNQTVNLGQEFRTRFLGVGSATASKDFQVTVNCESSPNGIENTVSLTMNATPDSSNAPGVLRTDTGAGTATGVGIQVLEGSGTPVSFGQAKELGMSKDGDYVVPFKARYYQVADKVGNGRANGRATVTLTYK